MDPEIIYPCEYLPDNIDLMAIHNNDLKFLKLLRTSCDYKFTRHSLRAAKGNPRILKYIRKNVDPFEIIDSIESSTDRWNCLD